MSKIILVLIFGLVLSDRIVAQTTKDWTTLTVNKGCTVNKKYCDSRLNIDGKDKATFTPCGQKAKIISIDEKILTRLQSVSKKQVKYWRENTSIDTACGYLIKLDNSTTDYYVVLDVSPDWYDQKDIKDFILTLNELFEKVE